MLTSNSAVIYDRDGVPVVSADGAAAPTSAIQVGGSDGTNLQIMAVDTAGRSVVVGAAADGAAPAGNPVLMAGQDGANVQSLLVDTTGRQVIVGAAADGAAAAGNPVLIAGQDGSANVQTLLVDATGALLVTSTPTAATTSTLTNVAASATSVSLLVANTARIGAIIVNDGNARLYVKFGTTASLTSYTVQIPAGGYYEVPFGYVGDIDGIWSTANGNARITELEL